MRGDGERERGSPPGARPAPPRARVLPGPGLPYRELLRPPAPTLPVPFDRPDVDLCLRGSTALWRGLQLFAPKPGHVILFPAYHCGIELTVVLKAGFQVEGWFPTVSPPSQMHSASSSRRARPRAAPARTASRAEAAAPIRRRRQGQARLRRQG